jgi:TolA-binding protein
MDEIRREINELKSAIEDRTEAIDKTLDASSQIARSMEELVLRQNTKNRFQQLNSFVAYILFTLLLGGAFFVLYTSRSASIVAARDEAKDAAKEARARARELQDSQVGRKRSARAAADYYGLIREGRHSEVISGYESLAELTLSETERSVFEDGLKRAKTDMVDAGYLAGVEAFRRNDFEAATAELRRGLAYAEEGERAAQMRYYLGISLGRQGSQEEAVRQLELAIAGRVEQAGIDDARFHLANTLVEFGREEEARQAFRKFADKHPNHRFAQMSRRKAAQILRAARERARMAREAPKPKAPPKPVDDAKPI